MSNFVHLHVHSEFSLLDGFGKAEQYVAEAKRLGQTHLAITDHGSVDGILKFQKACLKGGIKPILGAELYIVPDLSVKTTEKRYHITILIQNEEGLQNLFQMLSIANLEGFYRKPRIDFRILLKHLKGLIFMTACTNSFINSNWGITLLTTLKLTNPVYLEIMPHLTEEQSKQNQNILYLSVGYNIPLVATNDCHYPLPKNSKAQEVLLAIQRKKKWDDPDRWKFGITGLHLRSRDEMYHAFLKQAVVPPEKIEDALNNTMEVAKLCNNFQIKKRDVILPKVQTERRKLQSETDFLWEIISNGWVKRLSNIGEDYEVYSSRVDEEYNLIIQQGFQRYFLIVWELINWCKEQGIMTGPGRGSIGGSLVAYLMGITDVDPIKYNLIFSRFISPSRIDLPDIDMDFEDVRRAEVRKHLEDRYGQYNVAGVSTFMTMKGRGALRDVARVFDVPLQEVDKAAKSIESKLEGDPRVNLTILDACKDSPEVAAFQKKFPEVTDLAIQLEGQARSAGQHAAAICISGDDLREGKRCNFCQRSGVFVANWDKDDAEYMGLMKLDVLGLSALSILNYSRQLIEKNYKKKINFSKITLDNPHIYEELSKGHTTGIFQLGTPGMTGICQEMGIKEFNDIVLATAVFRPGALHSGQAKELILRKQGKSKVTYLHPKLKSFTEDTLGIIVFQEQVMWTMFHLAGLSWEICDQVRKVMGKSKGEAAFQKFKKQFIDGCKEKKTLSEVEANRVWDMLSSFGGYAFPLAHAVEYSLISYWEQFLKVFYPKEFMCGLLTYGGEEHKSDYIQEARRLGLEICLPRVGVSDALRWVSEPTGYKIFVPFSEIKGVGEVQAQRIANSKGQKTVGLFGEIGLVDTTVNKPTDEILNKIGAFTNRELTPEELKEVNKFFNFSLSITREERYARVLPQLKSVTCDEGMLYECNIPDVNLLKIKRYIKRVKDCSKCDLRKECNKPVNPSIGRYGLMVVGEAPGSEEDEKGIGFVGRAGEVLWKELKKYNISPFMLHISNIVKCFVDAKVKIFTLDGLRNISDIKLGDMVLTHRGRFKPVIWVKPKEQVRRNTKLVRIKVKIKGFERGAKSLTVTKEHPFQILVNKNKIWKKAEFIRAGDKLRILAKGCKNCEGLIPFISKSDFCSINCKNIFINKARIYSEKDRERISNNFKKFYEKGIVNRNTITKKANEKTRELVKIGKHHLQFANRVVVNKWKGKTKWDDDKLFKITQKSKETNQKSGHLKRLGIIGAKILKQYYLTHEHTFKSKHSLTRIEAIMAWALKKRGYIEFLQNKYLFGFYPDILFENHKIIVECDGKKFHSTKEQIESDKVRDEKLIKQGYSILRFKEEEIETDVFICVDKFERLLSNHSKKYKFITAEIIESKIITSFGKRYSYNFGVEEDESYIANGAVSHNCWPSQTKTPTKEHIKSCSYIITDEIEILQPILILAFGNTAVKFFRGQDSGITNLSGKTEWNDEYNCWIIYCLHPAAVLYQQSNLQLFQKGIENFANKVNLVGGNYLRKLLKQQQPLPGTCPWEGVIFGRDNNCYVECESCDLWDRCAEANQIQDWR